MTAGRARDPLAVREVFARKRRALDMLVLVGDDGGRMRIGCGKSPMQWNDF